MSTAKVAITIERELLVRLDRLVKSRRFPNRSRAVQEAVTEKLARMERSRLAQECAKLDRASEQAMAEEGMADEAAQWPEY
ncbi:MAG: ribbon-helix-helix domain-containing protein [candidate division WOR-3 bacterium]|nr:ribbon-helix-helix domain-containing protein [candidate division WOR-3 bacterium]